MPSGELARLTVVSTDTLRHRERLGLLPKLARTANGYRDYPGDSLEQVRLIRRAMSVGFSLRSLEALTREFAQVGVFPPLTKKTGKEDRL
jgi:MerR family transcriptional regulator, copper efflux regulator